MTTLKNLALALVNATVLLVALCLFLVLLITNSAERAADRFSDAVSSLAPVRTAVSSMNGTVQELRADLRSLTRRPGAISDDEVQALNDQIAALTAELETVNDRLATLGEVPDQVVTTAIDRIADRVTEGVDAYRSCTPGAPNGET